MTDEIYEQLAKALNTLPNGFPRTPANTEIKILKKIFTEEEALLASQLTRNYEPINTIIQRTKTPRDKTEQTLTNMTKRGLLWHNTQNGKPTLRLAPFIVGIYESQLYTMDHELAHLVEEYMADGGAAGIMKPQPAIHRVIPARKAVKTEWILPYDDVRAIINNNKTFHLRDCICRAQQDKIERRRCTFPLRTCLSFTNTERPAHPLDITREEALTFLDKTEEIGLVHTVSNVMKDFGYICNCCGCCCGILRGITDWGIENSVVHANYYAEINPDECLGCGTCIKRCQVHAITQQNDKSVVNREKCIGCGLCTTGCPNNAAKLHKKPKDQIVQPPTDYVTWEQRRIENRRTNA